VKRPVGDGENRKPSRRHETRERRMLVARRQILAPGEDLQKVGMQADRGV
jgi:hypothetical protein